MHHSGPCVELLSQRCETDLALDRRRSNDGVVEIESDNPVFQYIYDYELRKGQESLDQGS